MTTLTQQRPEESAAIPTGRIFKILGALTAALGFAVVAGSANAAELVTNGSFETGDFTGWTQFGNTGFTGVTGNPGPNDGLQAAFFGPLGSNGGISETLNTQPGRFYNISFDFEPDGGNPSFFSAVWDNQPALVSMDNPAASAYQIFHFNRLATTPTTALTFTFRDDPGFLFLDSVSVAVPEPATLALLGIALGGMGFARRRKVQ